MAKLREKENYVEKFVVMFIFFGTMFVSKLIEGE